jgi:DNA-binding transcriptional ArsR family regulator
MAVDVAVARSEVLRALAEPVRWRIVELLSEEELCVCHLVEELDVPQPRVSHHLKALLAAGLVESERFKQWGYYRLRHDAVAAVVEELRTLKPGRRSDRRRPCC